MSTNYGAPQYEPPQYEQSPQYGQPPYGQPHHGQSQYFAPGQPGPGGIFDGALHPDDLTRPLYGATFGQALKRFFKNYANFSGRASLSEYWWVTLASAVVGLIISIFFIFAMILMIMSAANDNFWGSYFLFLGFSLLIMFALFAAVIVPSISLTWRRLQDADKSGFFFFLGFIPYAGSIILLIFALLPSKPSGRRYDRAQP